MLNNKRLKQFDKDNKILLVYKVIPPEIRNDFKYQMSKFLGISSNYFYEKVKNNSFTAVERAILSYHLGIEQEKLFPSQEKIVDVAAEYKSRYSPMYRDFFSGTRFDYDPVFVTNVIYSDMFPKFAENL